MGHIGTFDLDQLKYIDPIILEELEKQRYRDMKREIITLLIEGASLSEVQQRLQVDHPESKVLIEKICTVELQSQVFFYSLRKQFPHASLEQLQLRVAEFFPEFAISLHTFAVCEKIAQVIN